MAQQTAIITGASAGIGRAFAQLLATRGWNIVLVARREAGLHAAADVIACAGGAVHVVPADIRRSADCDRIVEQTIEHFGAIDMLVNNAGIGHYHAFEEMPAEAYQEVVETNFLGVLHLTRAVLPALRRQRRGHIINVASIGAIASVPCRSIYCATKAALRSWSRALHMEVADQGIHVLCALPGSTQTDFFKNILGAPPVQFGAPGKIMTPEAVAQKILRAWEKGRHEIILSPIGVALELANRLSTRIVDFMIKREHHRHLARHKAGE
jgi:short-subunit dehydrogenase